MGFFQVYDSEFINQVQETVDVEDVLDKLSVEHQNPNGVGEILMLCPFHDDHNPSFSINIDNKRYICWSCNASGNIINLTMKCGNMSFPRAIQFLAALAGLEAISPSDEFEIKKSRYESLLKKEQKEQSKYSEEMIDGESIEDCNVTVSFIVGQYLSKNPDEFPEFDEILEIFDTAISTKDVEYIKNIKYEISKKIKDRRQISGNSR